MQRIAEAVLLAVTPDTDMAGEPTNMRPSGPVPCRFRWSRSSRRGALTDRAYLAVFHKARDAAFSPSESASLLARRPYELRHAAVSTWLNAGVPAPQVAEWAGHSVNVLLRVYAKCISGQRTRPSAESRKPPVPARISR
jgi:integrase